VIGPHPWKYFKADSTKPLEILISTMSWTPSNNHIHNENHIQNVLVEKFKMAHSHSRTVLQID
jgi:hypothetical protein